MFRVLVLLVSAVSLANLPACDTHATAAWSNHQESQSQASQPTANADGLVESPPFVISPDSLLAAQQGRPPPSAERIEAFELTRDAKRLIEAAFSCAAQGDTETMLQLVTTDAQWGLPDRAKRGAHALGRTSIDDFLVAFREAADRFPRRAAFRCAVLSPAASTFVASGAEPMWCAYSNADKTEQLAFELTTRDGRAHINYVGLFRERPTGPVLVASGDVPPDHPPLQRRNLEMTRRNIPALDAELQMMRRLAKRVEDTGAEPATKRRAESVDTPDDEPVADDAFAPEPASN